MHDQRLEDQLRGTLRVDGDALPFTITESELRRRLVLRRRDRSGQRMSLLAAGVAALAVAGIVGFGNGLLDMPAVGVDPSASPSPRPSASAQGTSTPDPTLAPRPTPTPTARASFRPAPDLGDPGDAVLVQLARSFEGGMRLQATVAHRLEENITLFDVAFPEDLVLADRPPRLGPTGHLALPVALDDGLRTPAGLLVYDLADPQRPPHRIERPDGPLAWGPTGLLATYADPSVTVYDPADGYASRTVPVGEGVLPIGDPAGGLIWAADGSGLLADRTAAIPNTPGILGLDGTWQPTTGRVPAVFAPTGLERYRDAAGRTLSIGCDAVGEDGEMAGCVLVAVPGGDGPVEPWAPAPHGYAWDAEGDAVWTLAGNPPGDIEVRHGAAGSMEPVVTLSLVDLGSDIPSLSGIAPSDERLVIRYRAPSVAEDMTAMVDTATREWYGMDGTFAGWADQSAAVYEPVGP